jgi:hypothetical protein
VLGTPVWLQLVKGPYGAVEVDVSQADDEIGFICLGSQDRVGPVDLKDVLDVMQHKSLLESRR